MDSNIALFKYEILHLNVRSARSNKLNLEAYISEMHFPEIICLNETKLPMNGTFEIKGYNIASRKEHSARGGSRGSMILTRKDIKNIAEIEEVKTRFQYDEVIGIEILKTATQPGIKIFTYYNPPLSTPNQAILQYIASLQGGCILTGDLNCKNTHWGSSKSDKRGTDLLDTLCNLNLITLNDESKTRVDPVTGKEESLDVIISNPSSAQLLKEFWVGYDIGSDHYPVHVTLQFRNPPSFQPFKIRKVEKLNVPAMHKHLKSLHPLQRAKTARELEENATEITKRINHAYEQCCPLTTIRKMPKCKFTPEIEIKVKEKRRLRREKNDALKSQNPVLARNIMTRINKLGNEIKKLQKMTAKADLERHCQALNKETNPKKFFDTFSLIAKPLMADSQLPSLPRPIEDEFGNRASYSQEKANLFANRLQQIHQEPNYAGFDNNWKKTVESYINENETVFKENMDASYNEEEIGDDSDLCHEVLPDEFESNLMKCKNRSAVGHDGIGYSLIKKLPKETKNDLCGLFSDAIRLGYFPKLWKVAIIKMIPKPNKDTKFAKNFRPISLLSCIGKLLERILANRLSKYMEEKNLFSHSQSGFRRHHMTTEQLLRLSEESHRAFKKKQTVAAIFLDAEAAFDKCWHQGIKYKLKANLNLPHRIIRLLSSFLSGRVLTVLHEGCRSHQVHLKAGTPQGSPLSPIIYIIYVNDYPQGVGNGSSLSQFADDTALWTCAYTRAFAIRTLQKSLNELESWCRRWRVKLNGEKSNLLFISRNWKDSDENYALHLFDDVIRPVKSAKFLGVEIDSMLSFNKHIDVIQNKSTRRINVLKALARNGVEPKILIRLYKIYVRPILEYGSASFISATTTQFDRLNRIQNSAIRTSLNLPKYIRSSLLNEYSGLEPIKDRIYKLNRSLMTRMKRHNEHVKTLCDNIPSDTSIRPMTPIELLMTQ